MKQRLRSYLNKDRLISAFGYRSVKVSEERWDREYSDGAWEWLASPDESAHYHAIANYCRAAPPRRACRVLDVGCGNGVLLEHLAPNDFVHYAGVDLSPVALDQARKREIPLTSFEHGDVNEYVPVGVFDIVVFNECLYYLDDPVDVIDRYATASPAALLVISMYDNPRSDRVWDMIDNELDYKTAESTVVTNDSGTGWTVRALRPSL